MKNDFASSARYYDVLQEVDFFARSAKFSGRQLKKHGVRSVLELGCGTGLYLFPLKEAGFKIEGLDISKEMLDLARKKGKIKLYKKDMSTFRLKKRFDAIMCMNSSLLYLPNMKAIEKTIKNVKKHLNAKGIFLLELPNFAVEIKKYDGAQDYDSFKMPNGKLDVIYRDYKKGNRWFAEWFGFAKEKGRYVRFHEKYSELIYSPKVLERVLKKNGFEIVNIFGSRFGGKLKPKKSMRRFYVCQKS